MSLRGLYQYLQLKSPTYLVRDGRHVFVYWRRADHVHARAKEYLQAKMPGIRSADMRAAQACQDLVDLNLLRCMENNEQKKWVSSDKSLRSIYYAAEFLRWRLTCGSAVFSGDHVIVLSISWIPARVEGRRDNSAQVSDGRRNLLVFKLRTPFQKNCMLAHKSVYRMSIDWKNISLKQRIAIVAVHSLENCCKLQSHRTCIFCTCAQCETFSENSRWRTRLCDSSKQSHIR